MDPLLHPDSERLTSDTLSPVTLAKTTRSLQRIARAVVRDEALAEDIVQSAWVEALERKTQGRGFGWLRKLVRSRSIDAVRRRAREPQLLKHGVESSLPQPDDAIGDRLEVQRQVLEAVDSLKEPYRSTIFLRYFEDLGPREIAIRQSLPVKTVKNRLTKAHALLRDRLGANLRDARGEWSFGVLAFSGLASTPHALPFSIPLITFAMKKITVAAFLAIALFTGWRLANRTPGISRNPVDVIATKRTEVAPVTSETPELSKTITVTTSREVANSPTLSQAPVLLPTAEFGSLRIEVVRANGQPAPKVNVVASTHPEESRLSRHFRRTTDENGVVLFDKLPVGTVQLSTDRLLQQERYLSEIREGGQAEAELRLRSGIHVVGTVLDEEQRPIAHAGVWLTANLNSWTSGGLIARTDASGYFEIEDVPPDQSIGAIAAGFLQSDLVDLDTQDKSVSPVQIELVLTPGGALLSGVVVDELGNPIEKALVVAGEVLTTIEIRDDDSFVENWSPQSTHTDADGRYSFGGLRGGPTVVQARSIDHALWTGEALLQSEVTSRLDITLLTGVAVHGKVTKPDGTAAPNSVVMAFTQPLDEIYVQGGQIDYYGTLAYPVAIADEEGHYELRQVAPGEAWLYAMTQRDNRFSQDELVKYTKAQLDLAPSSETTWNPVLNDGLVIEGHVYYSDGVKITDVFAILEGEDEEFRGARVDEAGFRFTNLGEGSYTVRIQLWSRPDGAADPYLEGLVPGGPPVEIVASFPAPIVIVPAGVEVRLVDSGDRSTASTQVLIARVDRYGKTNGTAEDDVWSFQIDKPGTYRAVALEAKRVIAQGETFRVEGGENIELDDLVTKPAGSLILRIDRPLDYDTKGLSAYVRATPDGHTETFPLGKDTELRLDNMEPGAGSLTLHGGRVAQLELAYQIQPGKETTLHVPLIPAVSVDYEIHWPRSESTGTLEVRFIDRSTGLTAHEVRIDDLTQLNSPVRWDALLPLGQYLYEVKKNGAVYASEEFEVTSLNSQKAPRLGSE